MTELSIKTIIENLKDLVIVTDSDGVIIADNARARDFLNAGNPGLPGCSAVKYFEAGEELYFKIVEISKGLKDSYEIETHLKSRDGDNLPVELSAFSLRSLNAFPEAIIIICRDQSREKRLEREIKERLLTEGALRETQDIYRESEEKYRTILSEIEEGYFEVDRRGNFTFSNAALRRIVGYNENELSGMNYRSFMDAENAKKIYTAFNRVYSTGKPYKAFNWEMIAKSSRRLTVETSISLIKNNEGLPVGFRGIVRDITERKLDEQKLWENEVRLRLQQMALAELGKNESFYRGDLASSFKLINKVGCNNLRVSRCGIWLYDSDRKKLKCQNIYDVRTNNNISGHEIDVAEYAGFFLMLEELRLLNSDDVRSDDRIFEFMKSYFPKEDIQSLLVTAFRLEGETAGLIAFDQIGETRKWTSEEKSFAASLADFATMAMETSSRRSAEEALRISEENLRNRSRIIEKDLKNAQIIQRALLPGGVPTVDRMEIEFRNYSVDAVGGDYFSFTPLREGGLGIFIGDVSGHGVSAALFLALLKSIADRACRRYGQNPKEYIETINNDLIDNMPHYFVTAVYGYFSNLKGNGPNVNFTFSKGGHPNPILYRFSNGETELLNCRGTIIGKFHNVSFEEVSVDLSPGDRIFLYTDGLPETMNEQNDIIGFNELPKLIKRVSTDNLGETLDAVIRSMHQFRGDAPIEDDIVLIGCEIK